LQARGSVGAKKQKKKGNFTSRGPNWVHSLDGHDKLMGYQNSTFPLAVYGCLDTASRKILWLKVWVSKSQSQCQCKIKVKIEIKIKSKTKIKLKLKRKLNNT